MTADFLIVGGGIGGAVLAELLGRGGKKVVVLEKSAQPPTWSRPEILWPATVELLFSLLPCETWEREAMLPLDGIELFDGRQFITPASRAVFDAAQVQPWSTDPNQTRELLLGLGSFALRRGVEVKQALKEGDRTVGVRARELASGAESDVLADWTVGDDGANSVVRQACGIELKTRLFPMEFFCFKFDWPVRFKPGLARVWLNRGRFGSGILATAGAPLPNRKGAGLVGVRGRVFDANPDVASSWAEFCASDAGLRELIGDRCFPQDFARIRRPWGHASRYGAPGAALIGDAAHPVSPVGGQGANMSVADARVLAEVALRNASDLLAEYERRRRPANERSMRFTRAAAFLLELPVWCRPTPLFFPLLRWVERHPAVLQGRLRFVSTAFLERARS
jgi:2-polyprenyl-6-methoxyphenol hydroxylase-like FAD-dependent oxidoreductase